MSEGPAVSRHPRLQRLFLAIVGGALTTLSIPPFTLWFVAPVGVAALMTALLGAGLRGRVAVSLVWASALYVPSLWWMTQFSLPGGIGVGLLEGAITAATLCVVVSTDNRRSTAWTVSAALVFADALRSLWPFGGLPLGGIDLGQAASPLGWFAMLGGRLLIVLVVAKLGAMVFYRISSPTPSFGRSVRTVVGLALGIVLSLAVDSGVLQALPNGTYQSGVIRLAIVQGGGPRGLRASTANARRTYQLTREANQLIDGRVDLILWPENVVDVDSLDTTKSALAGSAPDKELSALAKTAGATLIAGVTEDTPDGKNFVNYSVAYGPDGERGDSYEKVRRVPYGEFFPFRSVIEGWGLARLPARDARKGTKTGVLTTPAGTFAILISYEGFFDDRSRGGVRAGGEAVLIPTNAASYTNSHLPQQQVAAARLRAIETGRWVAQASTTGFSLVLDDQGTTMQQSRLGLGEVLQIDIARRGGLTPYMRFNDIPALLLAALALAVGWLPRLLRYRRDPEIIVGPDAPVPLPHLEAVTAEAESPNRPHG